jgi:N-acyl-D-aspartate/D-glutamate deacylase
LRKVFELILSVPFGSKLKGGWRKLVTIGRLATATLAVMLNPGSVVAAPVVTYDVVLTNGRVIDPATGLDAIRNIGIRDRKIAAISRAPLSGKEIVDVSGRVVSPGFIDLHSHAQNPLGASFQVRDGVTTALEMELGVFPVASWYAERAGKSLINYGATVSQTVARGAAILGPELFAKSDDPVADGLISREAAGRAMATVLAADQIAAMEKILKRGIEDGALGIGLGIAYVPGASREEILRSFSLAAGMSVPVFAHQRSSGKIEPDSLAGLQELIANAAITGASLHVAHISSSGLRQTQLLLKAIDGARAHGIDVTTEAYPFTGSMAVTGSPILSPGWQDRFGITYGDLQNMSTGERFTEKSFEDSRKNTPETRLIAHVIPEDVVDLAVTYPGVMIASDSVDLGPGQGHPRTAGTFSRVLGRYVREKKLLSLRDALARMTILPAKRLEPFVPAMAHKGRIEIGADADITVFDPALVAERASYANPMQASVGVYAVLVNGTFVVRDGKLITNVYPGQPILRHPGASSMDKAKADMRRAKERLFSERKGACCARRHR